MARVEQRRGGRRKITAEVQARLCGWVQAQPDLTLTELQQKLAKGAPPARKHRSPVASAAPEGSAV
jgi:hypothetical protein